MAELILVRHGQSTWNALDKWTGSTDVELSQRGRAEAKQLANLIRDKQVDACITSGQKRAAETCAIIQNELGIKAQASASPAINERDYGQLTGLKRSQVEKQYGHEQFMKWRRGWDVEVPGGENLKDVYNRAVPYFQQHILPRLKQGKNIMVVAHGNSLRALIKYLDNIPDAEISQVEMPFNEILVYSFDKRGKVVSKQKRNQPL